VKSKLGTAVLDALEMLDGDQLRPRSPATRSTSSSSSAPRRRRPGAQPLRAGAGAGRGRVLDPLPARARVPRRGARGLVHSGDVVVSITGKKIDASAIDQFAKLSVIDVAQFKHIERPRDLPLGALQELFDLLGVPKGLIVNPAKRDDAVTQLQAEVAELVNKTVLAHAHVAGMVLGQAHPLGAGADRVAPAPRRPEALPRVAPGLQHRRQAQELPARRRGHPGAAAGLALVREVEELGELVQQVGPRPRTWARPRRCSSRPPLAGPDAGATRRADDQDHEPEAPRRLGLPARRSARPSRSSRRPTRTPTCSAMRKARLGATDDQRKAGWGRTRASSSSSSSRRSR
jgi:hypothetical protein